MSSDVVVINLKVNKMHDYFVDNCLSPQYGESVTIGLSDYAPIVDKW